MTWFLQEYLTVNTFQSPEIQDINGTDKTVIWMVELHKIPEKLTLIDNSSILIICLKYHKKRINTFQISKIQDINGTEKTVSIWILNRTKFLKN